MGWVAPSVRSTGDLITASIWNVDLKDNLDYLKTEADKLDDASQSIPGNAKDTTYQNTSGKIRIVTVSLSISTSSRMDAQVASGTPPTTVVAVCSTTTTLFQICPSFVVPINWYYRIATGIGTITINKWAEWDLH